VVGSYPSVWTSVPYACRGRRFHWSVRFRRFDWQPSALLLCWGFLLLVHVHPALIATIAAPLPPVPVVPRTHPRARDPSRGNRGADCWSLTYKLTRDQVNEREREEDDEHRVFLCSVQLAAFLQSISFYSEGSKHAVTLATILTETCHPTSRIKPHDDPTTTDVTRRLCQTS
jgi:hypothetical protein